MIPDNVRQALTTGLREGYLGGGKFELGSVGAISFKAFFSLLRTLVDKIGIVAYRDCYHFGTSGFGFEVLEFEDSRLHTRREFARVYVGSVKPQEKLQAMKIKEKDVTGALKTFLQSLGVRTRLDEKCIIQNGNWRYIYEILRDNGQVFGFPFVLAEEEIFYFAGDGSGIYEPACTHYIVLIEIV